MINRALSLLVLVWAMGFLWFAIALPQPAGTERTDAIVVPTGSGGRIPRGLDLLRQGLAKEMLVTGVDQNVKPREFMVEYGVSPELMDCCVTLGFTAMDTRGNARETATWLDAQDISSLRLVTADWHMRRAATELEMTLPDGVEVIRDAVPSNASLWTLFVEYHKFLASWLIQVLSG